MGLGHSLGTADFIQSSLVGKLIRTDSAWYNDWTKLPSWMILSL